MVEPFSLVSVFTFNPVYMIGDGGGGGDVGVGGKTGLVTPSGGGPIRNRFSNNLLFSPGLFAEPRCPRVPAGYARDPRRKAGFCDVHELASVRLPFFSRLCMCVWEAPCGTQAELGGGCHVV